MDKTPRIQLTYLLLGLLSLLCGFLFYFLFRGHPIQLLPEGFTGLSEIRGPFGDALPHLSGSLPHFLHTLAFSLITAAIFFPKKSRHLFACTLWVFINVAFEISQSLAKPFFHPADWGERSNILSKQVQVFFLDGTFDVNDISATLLGGIVAFLILSFLKPKGGGHD